MISFLLIACLTVCINVLAWGSRSFCDFYIANIFPVWVNTYGRFTGIFQFSVGEFMLMAGCESIRDTIAFPKVKDSGELMIQSPDVVDKKQLDELGLAIVNGVDRHANAE